MAGSCFIRYWHIPELLPRKIGAWTSPQRHTLQRWRSGKTGRLPWMFGCLMFLYGKNTRILNYCIPWIIYAFYYKIYGHSWHFTILCKHSWHFLRVLVLATIMSVPEHAYESRLRSISECEKSVSFWALRSSSVPLGCKSLGTTKARARSDHTS